MREKSMEILAIALFLVIMLGPGCRKKVAEKEIGEKAEIIEEKEAAAPENSPPRITSLSIIPERPYADNALRAVVKGIDPDRDPVSFLYQWEKEGFDISGENSAWLGSGKLKGGDTVSVRVTPFDGKIRGESVRSNSIIIINTPPRITTAFISPNQATIRATLTAMGVAEDIDGDPLTYIYRWIINEEEIAGESSQRLDCSSFKKGDRIEVEITPSDGKAQGEPVKTFAIVIQNSSPSINSNPPTSLSKGNLYSYQVTARDPDGDPLSFKLNQAPEGMTIDESSGLIQWKPTREDTGSYEVEILAMDNDGGQATQKYSLNLSFPEETKE